jgi:hypothetical protein
MSVALACARLQHEAECEEVISSVEYLNNEDTYIKMYALSQKLWIGFQHTTAKDSTPASLSTVGALWSGALRH